MVRRTACLAMGAAAVAACAGTGAPDGRAGGERARARESAASAERSRLSFAGEFYAGSDPRAGITAMLTVSASGVGPAQGQRLLILVRGVSKLSPGRYAIGPMPPRGATGLPVPAVTVLLYRTEGDSLHSFVSRAGELFLTVSTPARLEGVLSFSAAEYCVAATYGRRPPYQRGPCRPDLATADALRVEISADFTATPESPKVVRPAGGLICRAPACSAYRPSPRS